MGLIRKAAAISSLGAVNYRSKGDRKVRVMEADSKAGIEAEKQRLKLERDRLYFEGKASDAYADAQYAGAVAAATAAYVPTIAERLQTLDSLWHQGLLTADDYSLRKGQILSEI